MSQLLDRISAMANYPPTEQILAPYGEPLTCVIGGQQCLRCGRFERETCNGPGLNVQPCRLGRLR